MAEKKEYTEFRELLKEAMNGKTQKEFAELSGLSTEHLNRMLKQDVIAQPSEQTLRKILKAAPLLNAYRLYEVCGYQARCEVLGDLNRLTLSEAMHSVAERLQNGFQEMIGEHHIYDSMADVLKAYTCRHGWNLQNIRLQMFTPKSQTDKDHKGAYATFGTVSWLKSEVQTRKYYTVDTYFMLYFYKLDTNQYLISDVAIDGKTLSIYGRIPDDYLEMVYEDGEDIKTFPFVALATEHYRKPVGNSPEERLLEALFGEKENEREMYDVDFGIGTMLENTPAGFVDYVVKNAEYFQRTGLECEITDALKDVATGCNELSVDDIVADYYFDGVKGSIAVITAIMYRKFYKENAKPEDKSFEVHYGMSCEYQEYLRPCLYVEEGDYLCYNRLDKERKAYIENCLKEEFRLLQIHEMCDVLVYTKGSFPVDEMVESVHSID